MIKHGRSDYMKSIIMELENKNAGNCYIFIKNGLHSSNIIEFRVEDVNDAKELFNYTIQAILPPPTAGTKHWQFMDRKF